MGFPTHFQAMTKFSTDQEVLAKAINTDYGLAAAIFTQDISRITRMDAAQESGMVTING
jgi:aldehyde dehydrogenase (NAD+)